MKRTLKDDKTDSPGISVVIPLKNNLSTIAWCLQSLDDSEFKDFETIVVDDGSDDGSLELLSAYSPLRLIRNHGVGVSSARNTGAKAANGEIILFIDADIMVRRQTLGRIKEKFDSYPDLDGLVGVLSEDIPFFNFSSNLKNLWMRYTYLRLVNRKSVNLFYTSLAAIRRGRFLQTDGFDERYRKPGIEDTVFGHALAANGFKIRVFDDIEAAHHKRYSLRSLLATDVERSASLVRFAFFTLRHLKRVGNTSSVPTGFMASLILILLSFITLVSSICGFGISIIVPLILLAGFYLLNLDYIRFLKQAKGWLFFMQSLLFLPLEGLAVMIGIAWGLISIFLLDKRSGCRHDK